MTEKLNEVLAVLPPAVTNWIDQYASGMTQTEMHADISHVISVDEFKQFIAVAMQEASTITDEATREKLVSELAEDISGIVSSDDEEGQRRVRELTRTALGPITVMDVATAQTRLKAADELLGRLAGTSRNIRWGLDIINRAIGAYRDLFFQNDGELVKYVNERIRRFERAQRRIRMQSYQPLQRGKNGISSSTTTEAEFNLTKRSGKKSKNAQSARAVKKKPDIVNSNDTRVDSLTQNTVLSQMVPGNSGNAPMRLPASRINVSPPEFTSQSATNPLPNPGQPFSLMRPDQVGVSISSQLSANMSSQLGTEMPSAATQVSVEEVLSKFVFDL